MTKTSFLCCEYKKRCATSLGHKQTFDPVKYLNSPKAKYRDDKTRIIIPLSQIPAVGKKRDCLQRHGRTAKPNA